VRTYLLPGFDQKHTFDHTDLTACRWIWLKTDRGRFPPIFCWSMAESTGENVDIVSSTVNGTGVTMITPILHRI
jgi:hypothetical protein